LHLDPNADRDEIATAWFARRSRGALTPQAQAELEAWLAADPANRAAYDAVELTWRATEALRADPEVLYLREAAMKTPRLPRRGLIAAGVAVAVALGVLLATPLALGSYGAIQALQDQEFRTGVGQQATMKLPDGSTVTLNTDSVLRTRQAQGERLLYLDRGQAYFTVAHDPDRPFIVSAGGRTVTALGTAFDVRVDGDRFAVTLVEGKVRVAAPVPTRSPPAAEGGEPAAVSYQATEMTAGSRLVASVTASEPWRVAPANVVVETSWTRDILIFDDEPLSAVVAELNRYSDKKMVVADTAIETTPISGTFRPGDVDSFVRTLRAYRLARAGGETPETVELRAYQE